MFARTFVNIGVAPGVVRDISFHVGPFPVLGIAGLLDEIKQAVFTFRIKAVVDFEGVKRGAEGGDLRCRGRLPGLFGTPGELGNNNGRQNPEDDQHQEELNQGEGLPPRRRRPDWSAEATAGAWPRSGSGGGVAGGGDECELWSHSESSR